MIRGLIIKSKDSYTIFTFLVNTISISSYDWYIIEDGIYENRTHNNVLNEKKYTGTDMESILNSTSIFVLYANFQAFPVGSKHSHIETYDDFLNSDCEIAIMIYDSIYNEIYLKDEGLIENIMMQSKFYDFDKTEHITPHDDQRYVFYVMK